MERASPEGQKHNLLKCLDAELGERMLAITDATTPIFDTEGNPTKSCFALLKEEFHRRFPVTNRRKDFFLQSQGQQQFTAYIDKLRNMAVEADLSNATAEDLIVVMGIVGCKDDELIGDLQKLEAPKLADIIKLDEAHERKTFVEKGFAVKVNAVQASTGAKPKAKRTDDPVPCKEIERLMKGKCYRCGEGHQTDQCSQKGGSLKCTACNRKGHVAKACYTEMLKKSGTVKTNLVSAAAPGTPALTYEETTLPTRMVRTVISANTVSSGQHSIPMVQAQSRVQVDSRSINLDEPPKPIPPLWM